VSELIVSEEQQLQAADAFFAGALRRIRKIAIVLGVVAAVPIWFRYGVVIGLGFVIGCIISYVNFVWLEQVINAVADRVTQTGRPVQTRGVVVRFMLRYGFIAIACFAILISSKSSVYGLLGGLFLTVAAILCEAVYEGLVAFRRGL
jgi:hypothetical protein